MEKLIINKNRTVSTKKNVIITGNIIFIII